MSNRPKTSGQVKAIFGAGRQHGLDDEGIRDVVEDVTKRTRHVSQLTHAEAEMVIARIKGRSFVPLRTLQYRRKKAGIQQLVTQEQLDKIVALAAQRHWPIETLAKFCKRQCKHERPRTTSDANKVIEALKAMNEREGLWAA